MSRTEQLSDRQIHGLLNQLTKNMEPQEAANQIIFYLSGYRLDDVDRLNLERSFTDETIISDVRFAAEVARDVIIEYEHVRVEDAENEREGDTTVRLEG